MHQGRSAPEATRRIVARCHEALARTKTATMDVATQGRSDDPHAQAQGQVTIVRVLRHADILARAQARADPATYRRVGPCVRFVFGFESGPKDRPRRELVVP
jgi:hypothetical protein